MYQEVLSVILSQSFIEKVLLIILTAILTGILIPYINSKIAQRKFKEQKLFEAEIARQSKIIESQNELLIKLEHLVHSFQLRAIAVAWYQSSDKNPTKFQESRNIYDKNAWGFFIDMQTLIGKASRFTSPEVQKELENFYDEMKKVDIKLVKLLKGDTSDEEWLEFQHNLKSEYGIKLKKIMELLAKDYGLSKMTNDKNQT